MGKEEKVKIKHLGRKVSLMVACLLIVSITVIVQLCVSMFRNLTMNILRDQCVDATNVLAYQLENYTGPEDMTELLDDLKREMDCEFTIFNGDVRAYTTILQNGKRAVGTKLSSELSDTILRQGKSYVGNAQILGVDHLCSYVPTRDENGQVNGLIFAGISVVDASNQINDTIRLATIVGVALVGVSLLILAGYIGCAVSKPLSRLTKLAQTMEQGKLGLEGNQTVTANIHSNDEIGLLANIFENTMVRLKGYIGEISTVLESISQGNLTAETKQDYVGDFASIQMSLDGILDKLNSTMAQISESSDYVSSGAQQMAIGAQALSQGAVEQADAVEQLDENIQEISRQVEQTAENAALANRKVEEVSGQLLESNEKMQEMIQAMQEIDERSNEIGKIISAIENISAQTNILALNAAVEAARAGVAGKGFAVVAEEVRELAGKSAEASKTTASLIESTIEAVKQGTTIANATASQLVAVVSGANEIVDTTNGIADAARVQADSISRIQGKISQISSVVQTNSATAQESAATSQQLSQQAGVLRKLISMFRIKSQYRD
ncbi:MAG: cache domain-containing protein [Lachnospiraceae bacterium]|nr:cache domain-containing protein [Lachnospiraceae bacterium]